MLVHDKEFHQAAAILLAVLETMGYTTPNSELVPDMNESDACMKTANCTG